MTGGGGLGFDCLSPLPSLLCFWALPRLAWAAGPRLAWRSRKPAGRGFPGSAAEEVGWWWAAAPHAPGRRPAQRQVGGRAGRVAARGGGRRAPEEPHTPALPGENPGAASPGRAQPDPARGRERARGGVRCAVRKRKLLPGPRALATSLRAARQGAALGAPGDGERTHRVGSGAPRGASPTINSSVRGREDGARALRAPSLLRALSRARTLPRARVGGSGVGRRPRVRGAG